MCRRGKNTVSFPRFPGETITEKDKTYPSFFLFVFSHFFSVCLSFILSLFLFLSAHPPQSSKASLTFSMPLFICDLIHLHPPTHTQTHKHNKIFGKMLNCSALHCCHWGITFLINTQLKQRETTFILLSKGNGRMAHITSIMNSNRIITYQNKVTKWKVKKLNF